ncbi:MAG: L,D-transpeptidase [Pseudomonadota bacterium]
MTTRRQFLGQTAAFVGALATPAIANAAAQPFQVSPRWAPKVVSVKQTLPAGEIFVVTSRHYLYLTLGNGQAMRYGVAVGAEGLNFRGSAVVARKVEWPSWRPTLAMIEREPAKYGPLADGMEGGPNNPLGARALYLFRNGRDTAYRIHGTPQPWSIGRSVSSGCIRMTNEHVTELYEKVPMGTKVTVFS